MLQRGDRPILNDPTTRRSWYSPGCGVCGLDIANKTPGIVMNERINRVKEQKNPPILSSGLRKVVIYDALIIPVLPLMTCVAIETNLKWPF